MSPEIQWVLACLRSLGRVPPPASLNWEGLLAFAEAEDLAPALGFAVKAGVLEGAPPAARERLIQRFTDAVGRYLILSRELGRLLGRFREAGIPLIPLKGPVLAEALYPDPALRPFSDLDLLIRHQDLLRADGLLHELGCRRVADAHSWSFDVAYDTQTLYEAPPGVRVDLHWGLMNDPRYRWDHREGGAVWDRALPLRVAGEEALGLCHEDLVLYLAVHLAVHHGLGGVIWYWDLALLLERGEGALDWEAIIDRAARWRVRNALYFALLGVERLFGVSAPAWVMVRLRPRGPRTAAVRWLLRHRAPDGLAHLGHLVPLLLVDRAPDLLGSLRRIFWPPATWVQARYAGTASSRPGQYLAHYRRMGEVAHEAIRGLTRRPH